MKMTTVQITTAAVAITTMTTKTAKTHRNTKQLKSFPEYETNLSLVTLPTYD